MLFKKIPVAIIGAGRFGKIHIKCINQHPLFDLTCVVDTSPAISEWSELHGYPFKKSIDDIPEQVRAAVVVVPSAVHDSVALPLIERGVALLVEKPLATSYAALENMLNLSVEKNCILCTGHIERFNRNVSRLLSKPKKIEFIRYSNAKKNNIESFLDLMVHDIDLVAILLNVDPMLNFDVFSVKLNKNGAEVFASVNDVELYFLSEFNAEHSYADIKICYENVVEYLKPTHYSDGDPLTRQYTSFYKKLQGGQSEIADGVAGMAAARRALQITEMI